MKAKINLYLVYLYALKNLVERFKFKKCIFIIPVEFYRLLFFKFEILWASLKATTQQVGLR